MLLNTAGARRGMAVAPHALAAQAAVRILRERGNAIEAMVAAATWATQEFAEKPRQGLCP